MEKLSKIDTPLLLKAMPKMFSTPKAELLQLKLTPIICLINFINKKVGN